MSWTRSGIQKYITITDDSWLLLMVMLFQKDDSNLQMGHLVFTRLFNKDSAASELFSACLISAGNAAKYYYNWPRTIYDLACISFLNECSIWFIFLIPAFREWKKRFIVIWFLYSHFRNEHHSITNNALFGCLTAVHYKLMIIDSVRSPGRNCRLHPVATYILNIFIACWYIIAIYYHFSHYWYDIHQCNFLGLIVCYLYVCVYTYI